MDIVVGIIKAGLMLGFVALAIAALAGLFMIIFGIATGIDRKIQE